MRVSDFVVHRTIKPLEIINASLNIVLTQATYMRIILAISNHRTILKDNNNNDKGTKIENFVARFKKGSRPFRNILSHERNNKAKKRISTQQNTYFGLAQENIENLSPKDTELFSSCWAQSYLPNKIKDFLFKMTNNKLPINTRL